MAGGCQGLLRKGYGQRIVTSFKFVGINVVNYGRRVLNTQAIVSGNA